MLTKYWCRQLNERTAEPPQFCYIEEDLAGADRRHRAGGIHQLPAGMNIPERALCSHVMRGGGMGASPSCKG